MPAAPWTSLTAWPPATSTAGSRVRPSASPDQLQPVRQQRGAGIAGLLRVELGRAQRAVLHRRDEGLAVLRPGQQRPGRCSPEPATATSGPRRSARSRTARPARSRRTACCRRRRDRVPAHVRQHGRLEPVDHARPGAAACASAGHARALRSNSTCMPTQMPSTGRDTGQPLGDDLVAAHRPQALHAGRERADAGHDQAVGPSARRRRPRSPPRLLRPAAARAWRTGDFPTVVEHDHDARAQATPARSQDALGARYPAAARDRAPPRRAAPARTP